MPTTDSTPKKPSPQDWSNAVEAFAAWSELSEGERAGFLERLKREQPKTAAQLEALIRADQEAEARAFLESKMAEPPVSLEGKLLGPWRVEKMIGAGGMGQVWLARRTDGLYDGLAAIKLMRFALADGAADARFAREGKLLGKLNHPNIARLLDAGVAPSGERYLVLEYVEGERIDRYCDAKRLGIEERVKLFISVCKAVAHAHESFIVHRDLKPSNIFVSNNGEAKLLDFGIAKLVAEKGDASELTLESGAALTPDYAAPEQLDSGLITTATDVFGLGIVLFELLSGAKPRGKENTPLSSPRADARPLWTLPGGEDAKKIAAARSTTVAGLRRELRGDIATVVGKAIKDDQAQRYRNALELADDLQRTLDRRPVAAQPDSFGYRLKRYLQRHAFGVSAAALVLLAIAGGVVGTLLQAREARREAEHARSEAARAVAVKKFLLDLFEQARSSAHGGTQVREATLNDLLQAGAKKVDSFGSQPETRDEIFEILIDLLLDTGDQKQVIELAKRRLDDARQSFGADDRRVEGADVELAAVLMSFGVEMDSLPAILSHAQLLLDRAGDQTSLDRAQLLRWQGAYDYLTNAKPPWNEHPMKRAVELLRQYPDHEEDLLQLLATYASIACRYAMPDEAMRASEELATRTSKRMGEDNLWFDEANASRGQFLMFGGHPAEAVPLLRSAVAGMIKHVGAASPYVPRTRFMVAESLLQSGHPDESKTEMDIARKEATALPDDRALQKQVVSADLQLQHIREGNPRTCFRR